MRSSFVSTNRMRIRAESMSIEFRGTANPLYTRQTPKATSAQIASWCNLPGTRMCLSMMHSIWMNTTGDNSPDFHPHRDLGTRRYRWLVTWPHLRGPDG